MPIQKPLHRTWALEPGVVMLEGRVSIGAAGAVVAATSRIPNVTVTHPGAGSYVFTIKDGGLPRGLVGTFSLLIAAGSPPLFARIVARTASSLSILIEDAAAADTDPPNGSEIHYHITAGNSSVQSPN